MINFQREVKWENFETSIFKFKTHGHFASECHLSEVLQRLSIEFHDDKEFEMLTGKVNVMALS